MLNNEKSNVRIITQCSLPLFYKFSLMSMKIILIKKVTLKKDIAGDTSLFK